MPYSAFPTRADGVDENHASDVNGPNVALGQFTSGIYHALETSNGGAADPTGAADSTAAIQGKLTAAPAGSALVLPPGTFLVSNLSSTSNVKIVGAGRNKTILKAKAGSTGTLLSHSSAWGELRDFDIDLTSAPTMDGLVCNATNEVQLRNIRVLYGARGIAVTGASGSCYYDQLYCKNQTTAGVQIGEGGAEHHVGVVQVLVDDAAVTMAAGFEWSRTAATDLGGLYGGEIRVTRSAGTITNGFKLHSTVANSFVGVFGTKWVADSINGGNPVVLQNVDNIRLAQLWVTGTGGYGVLFDGATNVLLEQWFASCPGFGAFDFAATTQAANWIGMGAGRCTQGTVFHLASTGLVTNLHRDDAINYDNSTYTNSGPNLAATAPNNSSYRRFRSPFTVLHPDGSNKEQSFGVQNALTNAKWSFRVDSGGNFQGLPDSFGLTGFLADPNGGFRANGPLTIGSTASGQPQIFMGSGAPSLPNGVASVAAGSVYHRTDTPTTANQRLYICSAGGASPTWIGIL